MIPLAHPEASSEAIRAVSGTLASGQWVQGPEVRAFEEALCQETGFSHAVAVSSGTAALFLGLQALGVNASRRVLCPALSWPSPAHAARLTGAELVLVDVDMDTWNASADGYVAAKSQPEGGDEKPCVALAIDQFGNPVDHEAIETATGSVVLKDSACALGTHVSENRSRPQLACLSFHPRKLVSTGEGGACLTDDLALADALRMRRNHGQRSPGVFELPAHNFRLSDIAAALGRVQLAELAERVERRRALAERYRQELPEGLRFQRIAPSCEWNVQTFGAVVGPERDRWIQRLGELGVQAGKLSYALSEIGSLEAPRPCPNAERIAREGLALPIFQSMEHDTQSVVIEAVHRCYNELGGPARND